MSFEEQLRDASHHRTSGDVLSYYKKTYSGQKVIKNGQVRYEWQSQLATRVAQLSEAKGEPIKRSSVLRRFQARNGKVSLPSKKHQAEYEELGETLPIIPPENGYHIYGTIWVKYTDDNCEERDFDEVITGVDADELAAAADQLQGLLNYYQTLDVNDDDGAPSACDDPELSVEAV